MHWNHRIIKREYPDAIEVVVYGIYEVYYNDKGVPTMCTEEPMRLWGESVKDLKETLKRMKRCLDEPVLDYDKDFPEQNNPDISFE